jgi:hypothetical protein
MDEQSWMPPLRLKEVRGQCELSLVGWGAGRGHTLQAAGDDLVENLLTLARTLRKTGVVVSSELPPLDLRLLEFTHDLLRVQAEGGDVHARVFGFATDRAL